MTDSERMKEIVAECQDLYKQIEAMRDTREDLAEKIEELDGRRHYLRREYERIIRDHSAEGADVPGFRSPCTCRVCYCDGDGCRNPEAHEERCGVCRENEKEEAR